MKNGKMKFILPFFIYPDDKKRPKNELLHSSELTSRLRIQR